MINPPVEDLGFCPLRSIEPCDGYARRAYYYVHTVLSFRIDYVLPYTRNIYTIIGTQAHSRVFAIMVWARVIQKLCHKRARCVFG